jgi:hypothetical protein
MAKAKKKPAKKAKATSKAAAPLPPATTLTSVGPFRLTPNGMSVVGKPTFEEWETAIKITKSLGVSLMWIIGDLIVYGEERFGEDYAQALDAADYSDETIRIAQRVAKRFPPSERVAALTFTHHQEVAALPPAPAREILRKAESHELSSRDVRKLARDHGQTQAGNSGRRLPDPPSIPDDITAGDPKETPPEAAPESDPSDAFADRLAAMCRELDDFGQRVAALKDSPYGRFVHWQSARDQIKNARETLWGGRPTHDCPYCRVAGGPQPACRCCGGLNVCTKSSYTAGVAAVGGAGK